PLGDVRAAALAGASAAGSGVQLARRTRSGPQRLLADWRGRALRTLEGAPLPIHPVRNGPTPADDRDANRKTAQGRHGRPRSRAGRAARALSPGGLRPGQLGSAGLGLRLLTPRPSIKRTVVRTERPGPSRPARAGSWSPDRGPAARAARLRGERAARSSRPSVRASRRADRPGPSRWRIACRR